MRVTVKINNQNYSGHLLSDKSLSVVVNNDPMISDNVLNDVQVVNDLGINMVADFLVIRVLEQGDLKRMVLQVIKNSLLCLYNAVTSVKSAIDDAVIKNIEKEHQAKCAKMIDGAFTSKSFLMYYQPKVDVENQEVIGFEALARWQHPKKGILPPDEFLPMIDTCGYQFLFDSYVVDAVLQQQASWLSDGYEIPVSINVSSSTILNDLFCPKFFEMLASHKEIRPDLIQIELLETSHFFNIESARDKLKEIRNIGVEIAFDDFGTGYSTFEYIKHIETDYVKIDRVFIGDGLDCKKNKAIVDTIIQLAEAFGAKVIAEGIEDIRTLDQVQKAGCHVAQGYFFSRPIPSEQVAGWLKGQKNNLINTFRYKTPS